MTSQVSVAFLPDPASDTEVSLRPPRKPRLGPMRAPAIEVPPLELPPPALEAVRDDDLSLPSQPIESSEIRVQPIFRHISLLS